MYFTRDVVSVTTEALLSTECLVCRTSSECSRNKGCGKTLVIFRTASVVFTVTFLLEEKWDKTFLEQLQSKNPEDVMYCEETVFVYWLVFCPSLSSERFFWLFSRFCRSSSISSIRGGMEPGISIFNVTTRSAPVEVDIVEFYWLQIHPGDREIRDHRTQTTN